MLLDTNVFVDLFREYKPAIAAFDRFLYGQKASIMSKLELVAGEKTRKDMIRTIRILENLQIKFLPVTPEVCEEAETIILNYHKSRGIGILDAFIAGTALVYDEELVTRNIKHFEFIPKLKLIQQY